MWSVCVCVSNLIASRRGKGPGITKTLTRIKGRVRLFMLSNEKLA